MLNLSDLLDLLSDYDVIGIGSLRNFCVPCSKAVVPLTNIDLPSVKWNVLSTLDLSYRKVLKERMPGLFQNGSADNVVSTHLRITGRS